MKSTTRCLARWATPALAALALGGFIRAAGAQADTPPSNPPPTQPQLDPALTDPSNEDRMREQSRKPVDIPPVEPNKSRPPQRAIPTYATPGPGEAGLDSAAFPVARFFPEGTLVRDRRGTFVIADQGDVILVPPPGDPSPLLVVLPCQRLSQMSAARAAGGPDTKFIVSGQIFVYRDREFLLPSVFAVDHTPVTPPPPPTVSTPASSDGAVNSAVPTSSAAAADPRVGDLIRDLESQRLGPRRISAPVAAPVAPLNTNSAAPLAQSGTMPIDTTLRPEGTLLVSRRGRLIRIAEEHGRLAFVLDNDPDSPAGKPLMLQPCQMLERMEAVAATRGDDLVFRVSGRVSVNDGKNYLLPTFHQVTPKSDVTPLQ